MNKMIHSESVIGNEVVHGQIKHDFMKQEVVSHKTFQQLGYNACGVARRIDGSKDKADDKEGIIHNLRSRSSLIRTIDPQWSRECWNPRHSRLLKHRWRTAVEALLTILSGNTQVRIRLYSRNKELPWERLEYGKKRTQRKRLESGHQGVR